MLHALLILALIPPALYGLATLLTLACGAALVLRRALRAVLALLVDSLWTRTEGRIATLCWLAIGLVVGASRVGLIR